MAEWPCCHDPLRFSPMSLRFVPPEPLQGHGVAEAATRSGSVPGISGPDSPRLDEEDCWSGYRGGGSHATGGKDRQRRFGQLGARRGKSAAQIFRRTRAGRRTVQARQEKSSRGLADETALVQARGQWQPAGQCRQIRQQCLLRQRWLGIGRASEIGKVGSRQNRQQVLSTSLDVLQSRA